MKEPLLTICIATYNRAGFIAETLESIIPQIEDDIEVVIVDGASTDRTEEVVRRYADHDPRIRYVRLASKGGVDHDYCKGVELSRGEYCWLFTDDDLLKPGAVAAVRKGVRDGNSLVVVNAEVRDYALAETLKPRSIAADEDKSFGPEAVDDLCGCALTHLSFIGAVVIRRDLWLSRDASSYFGTEFVHVGVIFQKPLPGPTLVIAEPLITIRYGNGQWKPRGFEIWMIKWPGLVWSFPHISQRAKRSVTREKPWRNLGILLFERGIGAYSVQHYRKYLSRAHSSGVWKALAFLIANLPERALASALYLFCRVAMPDKMFLYDLRSNSKA